VVTRYIQEKCLPVRNSSTYFFYIFYIFETEQGNGVHDSLELIKFRTGFDCDFSEGCALSVFAATETCC
jgi:hypothetical protein